MSTTNDWRHGEHLAMNPEHSEGGMPFGKMRVKGQQEDKQVCFFSRQISSSRTDQ